MKKKGFTLIELLVVVAIIALLVTILLPSLGRARALAKRAACASNLSSISKGLALYKGEYNDSAPWIVSNPSASGTRNAQDNMIAAASDVYTLLTSADNNCASNLNMLVAKGSIAYKAFLCPGGTTNLHERTPGTDDYGFDTTSGVQLEYGYHAGWGRNAAGDANCAPMNDNMSGDFIVMADMNELMTLANVATYDDLAQQGWSHGTGEGINILANNASVAWKQTTECDLAGGSLYVNNTTGACGDPETANDTVVWTGQ